MGLRRSSESETNTELITRKTMGSKLGIVTLGMQAAGELDEHGQVTFVLSKNGDVRLMENSQVSIRKPTAEEVIQMALSQGKNDDEIVELLAQLDAMGGDFKEWDV